MAFQISRIKALEFTDVVLRRNSPTRKLNKRMYEVHHSTKYMSFRRPGFELTLHVRQKTVLPVLQVRFG